MAETVTPDEASILQDFFAVQADKHGPGIFAPLQSAGQGEEEPGGPGSPAGDSFIGNGCCNLSLVNLSWDKLGSGHSFGWMDKKLMYQR